jgi:hypothetical protein
VKIGCIVEGHGEEQAVPILLRRFASERLDPPRALESPAMLRVSKDKLKKTGELERSVELVARKLGGRGAILVLLDADDDPTCKLGPELLERARAARSDLTIGVVLANRAFEAWFLASIESLAGFRGLPAAPKSIVDPERKRDAKGQLAELLGRRYSETLDQPAFTAKLDLDMARRAPSFDKCYREILRLLTGS